jgi:membrane protein YqaA with SNARE-associated domain
VGVVVLLLVTSWGRTFFSYFRRLGAFGLFLLGIADSSFLFLPLSNDLLLIIMVSGKRDSWSWIVYTVAAALGSLVGVMLLDHVMRKVGQEGLEKFVGTKRVESLKKRIEDRGIWAVFFASIMPPPFPFTAIVAAASALQTSRRKLLATVFSGRLIRFSVESLLALYFGRRLLRYLRSEYVEYFVYGFIVIALVGSVLAIRKWLKLRPRHVPPLTQNHAN